MSLLVAEDEDVIRNGIVKYIILHTDRFTNIYEAQNAQEAIDLMMKHQPIFFPVWENGQMSLSDRMRNRRN